MKLLILISCLVCQGAPAAEKKESRLSWGPYEFLMKGFRNAPWIHDPFFPETKIFRLSGIISDEMAFINGKWFKLGERIEGFEVKKISAEGVTLARRGEVIVLKIAE